MEQDGKDGQDQKPANITGRQNYCKYVYCAVPAMHTHAAMHNTWRRGHASRARNGEASCLTSNADVRPKSPLRYDTQDPRRASTDVDVSDTMRDSRIHDVT